MSEHLVTKKSAMGSLVKTLAARDRRIAEMQAEIAKMQPLWEAVETLGLKMLGQDAPNLNAFASDDVDDLIAKFGNMFQHVKAVGNTLPDALIALAAEVEKNTNE